jgi:hypothetical protein
MNVQSAVDQPRRVLEDLHRQAQKYLASNADTGEPTAGELWGKVSPKLNDALAIYERKESPETPDSSRIPGRTTKESCQNELDEILDAVLAVLGTSGAAGYRTQIRDLQSANTDSQARVVQYREQMLSAPAEKSQNFVEGLVVQSKEELTDSIADESERISQRNRQMENLKICFRERLERIGIHASPETADSFLLPVEDDVISMAAVISNIGIITEQLQELVEASREAPAETKRYYGMYLLLVTAVDRIRTHFDQEIDARFLHKIAQQEQEACHHIADAQGQLKAGGPKETLQANVAANRRTIRNVPPVGRYAAGPAPNGAG